MLRMIKRLIFPSITDKQVSAITKRSEEMLDDTSRIARRHKQLLDKNGFTMRIYIASGGDKRGIH